MINTELEKIQSTIREIVKQNPHIKHLSEVESELNNLEGCEKISNDNSIHFYVRTTGERNFDYGDLKITNLIDYEHNPINSFIKSLIKINPYNSILLEDDLVLCKNFEEEIKKAVEKYPNNIIQFFTDPGIYESTYLRSYPFEFNQCTYYPKGIGIKIAKRMIDILPKFPKDQLLYSQVENRALIELCIPHIVYRPCLVQHNNQKSILREGTKYQFTGMETIWFKDYIEELGINYEEAYQPEYIRKLFEIKNRHFDELNKRWQEKGY